MRIIVFAVVALVYVRAISPGIGKEEKPPQRDDVDSRYYNGMCDKMI